ncbi:MAG: hypothetical protein D3922_04225 [Candidatus Electrothrix sp. AR1]|nr:hypothetical protein [Candidatus Electrothrix sp. AR1]
MNGSIFTTVPVTQDCTVEAQITCVHPAYLITPSVDPSGNGAINPDTLQFAYKERSKVFELIPDAGYHVGTVLGTCGGIRSGNIFTTAPATANCTVIGYFSANTFEVNATAGANGTITPSGLQYADYNETLTFTLEPNTGFEIGTVMGCDGMLENDVYTTAAITESCDVTATFKSEKDFPWLLFLPAIHAQP